MKINANKVKFKNFLSYGSKYQEIEFKEGLNLVTGYNSDSGKSNGSGKSAFLETVPFALFGKTQRNIKKEQIINWKNRKNCEVIFDFTKGSSSFRIIRAIKPDNFEIYENEKLIDKPSTVKEYQVILEEIIGLNYTAFMSLIHSNINSSMKILAMSTPEKRKFIERMFDIDLYTKINEEANKKISKIKEKTREIELNNGSYEKLIEESKKRIKELQENNKSYDITRRKLIEIEDEIVELDEKMRSDYGEVEEKIRKIEDENQVILTNISYLDNIINNIKNRNITSIRTKFRMYKDKLDEYKRIDEKYNEFIENQKELLKEKEKLGKTNELEDRLKEIEEGKTKSNKECDILTKNGYELKSKLQLQQDEEKRIEERIKLLKKGICPTCGNEFKDKNELKSTEEKLVVLKESILYMKSSINENEQERTKEKETFESFIVESSNISNKIKRLNNIEKELLSFDNGYNKEVKEKDEKKYKKYYNILKKLEELKNSIEKQKLDYDKKYRIKEEERQEILSIQSKIKEKEIEEQKIKERFDIERETSKKIEGMIEEEKKRIDENEKVIRKNINDKKKFNEMIDYLNPIKVICKDENIKQFAISSIMPILNERTNKYLSNVGYPFYVKLNGWLDSEIKGPGITKASYTSLSGGEGRGIDIAIQLAFLDIAKERAGVFPDFLILDELLDSSIDEKGISELFQIIKSKQMKEKSKVFLISHRNEIEGKDEIDNIYHVIKENGYSRVEII